MERAVATTPSSTHLDAARRQDEGAFERLVGPHRPELQAHCYRMLGSAADAEDALQETLLRAWRALPRFEGRSSVRTWLYRIATNVCLRMLEGRRAYVLPIDYGPPGDPHGHPDAPVVERVWLEPYPDEEHRVGDGLLSVEARYEERESVELAFVAALQNLPARQRAALLLRDVLGFAPREISDVLDASPASVYSLLQRARQSAVRDLPERSQQATLRSIDDARLRELVERYVRAWEESDVAALVELLTDDVTLAMPPVPSWYRGRSAVGAFLAALPLAGRSRWGLVPVGANGQLAFGVYRGQASATRLRAHAIELLTVDARALIADITVFLGPRSYAAFGLPDEIDVREPPRR